MCQTPDLVVSQFDRKCFTSVIWRESVGANATEDDPKDPENASSAMPSQGILPKLLPLLSDASSLIHGKQKI